MQDHFSSRARPANGGYITIGTLMLAAVSALTLVLMSGCHATPAANGFASTASDRAAEGKLRRPDSMAPLQPFDEGFVSVAPDAQ